MKPSSTVSDGIRLRPVEPADEEFLRTLYESTRQDELALLPWGPAQRAAFVDMQFRAQAASYQTDFPAAEFGVVLVDGEAAGRLSVDRSGPVIEVLDIALLPDFRGAGTGTGLLTELLREASASERPVRLHVDTTNRARQLYERLGFRVVEDLGVYLLLEWTAAA
jgi:ribosomal protein S18 acetylase RimI-like enzyme